MDWKYDYVVILPNSSKRCLCKSLESINNQILQPKKILITHDNPELKICCEVLCKATSKAEIHRNLGLFNVSKSRNFAISKSNSSFIAFLDDDDTWEPNKMSIQLTFMNQMNIQITGTNALKMSSRDPYFVSNGTRFFHFSDFLKQNEFVTSSVVIARNLLDPLGGFRGLSESGEDYVLWLRIHFIGIRSARIESFLVNYQDKGESLSRQFSESGSTQKLRLLKFFLREVLTLPLMRSTMTNLLRLVFEIMRETRTNAKS